MSPLTIASSTIACLYGVCAWDHVVSSASCCLVLRITTITGTRTLFWAVHSHHCEVAVGSAYIVLAHSQSELWLWTTSCRRTIMSPGEQK